MQKGDLYTGMYYV